MAKYPPITKKMYDAAKILQKGGADRKEIADYLTISISSVDRILSSDSFDDFQNANKARAFMARKAAEEKKQAKIQPVAQTVEEPVQVVTQEVIHKHEQSVTVIANHYMAEQLQRQTELLTLISNKLAFIVDELCGVSSKKEC